MKIVVEGLKRSKVKLFSFKITLSILIMHVHAWWRRGVIKGATRPAY